MKELCAKCNVCHAFMPEQKHPIDLFVNDQFAPVLVIDDVRCDEEVLWGLEMMEELLGKGVPYTYTKTVRCTHVALNEEQGKEAVSRCSVWTNSLLEGRALIITTVLGLQQMKIGEGKEPGDLFRNEKVGVVLVIEPSYRMSEVVLFGSTDYKSKAKRAMKAAGLVK